jgi:DNA repair protein RecN (Recombination protein N)
VIVALEVRDLAVIARAELLPSAGFTAITGETGAGKTVLAQAIGLLAGSAPDPGAVRPGARQALVQATLALPEGWWDGLDDDDPARPLAEQAEDPREVVVTRRVPAEGRARALLDGQAAPTEAVASLVTSRVRATSQHEGRRLVAPAAQLGVLDAFAGPDALAAASRLARLRRRERALARELAGARARRAETRRRREDLEALVADVAAAALDPAEEEALRAERERLRHAERLAGAAAAAAEAVAPESGDGGALGLAGTAGREVAGAMGLDPGLAPAHEHLAAAEAALQEAALALRGYLESLEAEPGRLEQVEERLETYARLGRRHGPGTEEVLRRAAAAAEELEGIASAERDDEALAGAHAAAYEEARELAAHLAGLRAEAAPRLAEAASAELAELGLPVAALRVELGELPGDPPGVRCTILLRANPGLPEAPIAEAASGGELARVLLALHGAAAAGDGATWVFDEVDSGLGGVTASAVGRRLAALARGRQVVAITHLPQIAAAADAHLRLVKGTDDAGTATTRVEPLVGDALVAELCRMLGAGPADAGARRHAEELLARRQRA